MNINHWLQTPVHLRDLIRHFKFFTRNLQNCHLPKVQDAKNGPREAQEPVYFPPWGGWTSVFAPTPDPPLLTCTVTGLRPLTYSYRYFHKAKN